MRQPSPGLAARIAAWMTMAALLLSLALQVMASANVSDVWLTGSICGRGSASPQVSRR
jgi:hypothetical protein